MKDIETLPENYIKLLYENIGKNVKKAREDKGLTQLQLSQAIGHKSVTIVSLAELYHKGQHFNIEHLAKIAYVLNIDICDLLRIPDTDIS